MTAVHVAGLVLAGGKARRFGGGDKPLMQLGGSAMLGRVVEALRHDLQDIAISANGDPARFAGFGLPVLADGPFEGEGPLAGVLAGLGWASERGASALLTVPGDTPLVPRGLAATLTPAPACASTNHRPHYLVALWPVTAREPLRRLLASSGRRDVAHFARLIGMRRVEFPVTKWDPFLNINTPADLAAARAIVEGKA
ncbi:MAG TPA: molybdenum cofactor guanylyltransferase MobA [Acetobacteraceae bacterium]